MDDLLQEFIAETRETLEALSGEIVAWEADPNDRARLDAIFRFVHTVKGSCGFLNLPRLERLSHAAEDVLAAVRDNSRRPGTSLVNAVLAIVDRIGEIVEAIDTGQALNDSGDDLLVAALAEDAEPVTQAVEWTNQRKTNRSVRLNVDLLDVMMSGMSEMVLARNELVRRLRGTTLDPDAEAALDRLSLTVSDMRDTVTRTRMQKIDTLFTALPRIVRDTASSLGKAVTLHIDGADVELDRELIELLRDPLVHILRNSIDHGVEAPPARTAAGKSVTGKLTVSARQAGNQVLIEIADDGAGINVERLVQKALSTGLCSESEVGAMNASARLDLIFEPGLSSRDAVTAISGRGVGMDVVRSNIETIGGRITLDNRPGSGLTILIRVPLTLSILPTILVGVGNHRFALARQSVEEIITLKNGLVRVDTVGSVPVATVRGKQLPMLHLARLLNIEQSHPSALMIIGTRNGSYALAVDAVLDTEELVVKPAAPAVMATGIYAGQTLPDCGLPMLLLDGGGLADAAGLSFVATNAEAASLDDVTTEDERNQALLFDDLDGQRRAIALGVIDRVETVEREAIRVVGGRKHVTIDGATLPIHLVCDPSTGDTVTLLRLSDNALQTAYAIGRPVEIIDLPALTPARGNDFIAGIATINGMPIEIVDPLTLFKDAADMFDARPVCLLRDDGSGWMNAFLRPTLEANGYRCVAQAGASEQPVVMLAFDDAPPPIPSLGVVRLRHSQNGGRDSIYRYDRAAVIAALASHRMSA